MKNYILILKRNDFCRAISLASCTGWFDNVPFTKPPKTLEGDNVKVGVSSLNCNAMWSLRITISFNCRKNLVGDIYSGYMAIPPISTAIRTMPPTSSRIIG